MSQPSAARRLQFLRLATFFGAIYFVQGISEPGTGLVEQPLRSLLEGWGEDAAGIALLMAWISLPWTIKPVYGLLTDFIPLAGYRRKSYLVLSSLLSTCTLIGLFLWRPGEGDLVPLCIVLFVAAVAIAFADVVADGLMVEAGQPAGITGQLQSVQWTSIYAATIVTGTLGGWLSQNHLEHVGFLVCGLFSAITLVLALTVVREPKKARFDAPGLAAGWRSMIAAVRSPALLGTGSFLFLWSFNPFSSTVLDYHMTQNLGFSEQLYGNTASCFAVAAVVGSVSYGFYCRRIPFGWLLHVSIAMGVLSTLAYWWLDTATSAMAISAIVGFSYITGSLVQLDLAARTCPPHLGATSFAVLMALANLSVSISTYLGGLIYTWASSRSGPVAAFNLLVLIGAACTACCWLIVPWLRRAVAKAEAKT